MRIDLCNRYPRFISVNSIFFFDLLSKITDIFHNKLNKKITTKEINNSIKIVSISFLHKKLMYFQKVTIYENIYKLQ